MMILSVLLTGYLSSALSLQMPSGVLMPALMAGPELKILELEIFELEFLELEFLELLRVPWSESTEFWS